VDFFMLCCKEPDANIQVFNHGEWSYFSLKKYTGKPLKKIVKFGEERLVVRAPSDVPKQTLADITIAALKIPPNAEMNLIYSESDIVLSMYNDPQTSEIMCLNGGGADLTSKQQFASLLEILTMLFRENDCIVSGITPDTIFVGESGLFLNVSVVLSNGTIEDFGKNIANIYCSVFQLRESVDDLFDNVDEYLAFMTALYIHKYGLTGKGKVNIKPLIRAKLAPRVAQKVYDIDDGDWFSKNPKKTSRDKKIAAVFGVGYGNGFIEYTSPYDPKTKKKSIEKAKKRKHMLAMATQTRVNTEKQLEECKDQLAGDNWMLLGGKKNFDTLIMNARKSVLTKKTKFI